METTLLNRNRVKKQLIKILEMDDVYAGDLVKNNISDLDLLRIISPIDLLEHCDSVLPRDERVLRTLFFLTTLESLVASKKTNKEKVKLVSSVIRKYLSDEEQEKLLGGFIFTETYTFGGGRLDARHLMFKDSINDENFNKYETANTDYCSTSNPYSCRCVEWLRENKAHEKYIQSLVERLGEMRGALLHEGFKILWFPDYEYDSSIAMYSATLVDAHPTNTELDVFRTYESGLDSSEFIGWVKKVMREYLKEKVRI